MMRILCLSFLNAWRLGAPHAAFAPKTAMPHTPFSSFFRGRPCQPLSRLVVLSVIGLLLLPAGCTANGRSENVSFLKGNIEGYAPSPRSERIFAQLKLDRALSINDADGILDACDRLLDSPRKGDALPSSKALIDAALWLLAHERAQDAENLLERAAKTIPEDLPLLSLYTNVLFQQKQEEKALRLLQSFAQRHPKDSQAQAELALGYLNGNKVEQALAVFRKIPENSLTPQIRFAYAQALNSVRHSSEAERELSIAVKDDPDYTEAWQLLALTKEELGKEAEAVDIYRRLLELDSSNYSARVFLLRSLLRKGDLDGAARTINESQDALRFAVAAIAMLMEDKNPALADKLLVLLEAQPHAPKELFFYHGGLLQESGMDLERALSLLDKVPSSSAEYEKALRLKASVAYQLKDRALTEKILQEIKELNPDDAEPILLLSELWMSQNEFDKTDALLSQAKTTFPNNEEIAFQLAFLRELQGRRTEAMSMMENIIAKYPENAFALNYVGYNLADSNRDLDRALNLLERAVALQPEADYIIDSLAWVHFRLGHIDEAWKQIQKAIKLNAKSKETDPTMLEHYGDIAKAAGVEREALQAWQKAEERFSRLDDKEAAARIRAKLEKCKK